MSFWMDDMANRSLGRTEAGVSSRPFDIPARLETVHASHVTSREAAVATIDARLVDAKGRTGRELMRLECARQLIDGEIARLREILRLKTS